MKSPLLLGALLLTVAVTGVQVSQTAHAVRRLHSELETLRLQQDQALNLRSQLLLEIGAVASLSQVQQVAQERLHMQFPARPEQVLR